ncbi:MAG TPA: hypothetical protein PLL10_03405, partial [Elusimicrobiales bacterium]|nr:hypothetical protein [Elusimicrobiales bacterium]
MCEPDAAAAKSMKNLSEVLQLAWTIAAGEASSAGYQVIETEHIIVGITAAGKVLPLSSEQLRFSATKVVRADQELRLFKQALSSLGVA